MMSIMLAPGEFVLMRILRIRGEMLLFKLGIRLFLGMRLFRCWAVGRLVECSRHATTNATK